MGIYCLQCGMCLEDKSLQHTEIEDSPVARALDQQKSTVILDRQPLVRVSQLSQYLLSWECRMFLSAILA